MTGQQYQCRKCSTDFAKPLLRCQTCGAFLPQLSKAWYIFITVIAFFVILSILIDIFAEDNSQQWFAGGTLHDANNTEWLAATPENRLATAADFTFTMLKNDGLTSEFIFAHMDGFKRYTTEVVTCMNETATVDKITIDTKFMFTGCYVLLKQQIKEQMSK